MPRDEEKEHATQKRAALSKASMNLRRKDTKSRSVALRLVIVDSTITRKSNSSSPLCVLQAIHTGRSPIAVLIRFRRVAFSALPVEATNNETQRHYFNGPNRGANIEARYVEITGLQIADKL